MKALTDFPKQRAWLLEDFNNRMGTAVEELVRWATPVMTFRRTAAADFELGGQSIRAGEKVVMFYASGNWDEDAFDRPDRFNLSRSPTSAWAPMWPGRSCAPSSASCPGSCRTSRLAIRCTCRETLSTPSAVCRARSDVVSVLRPVTAARRFAVTAELAPSRAA